jgi:chemotaxis protein histidine kinase CheA
LNTRDTELREEFKRDFLEQLQEVERLLLKLENDPQNPVYVREIFRPFHTIKGNAGVIGEQEIQDISQLTETILDQARQGKRTVTENMIDLVFQSVDLIKSILAHGEARAFSNKIDQLTERLTADAQLDDGPSQPPAPTRTTSVSDLRLDHDLSVKLLGHLGSMDKQITQCRLDRDFEPNLFDLFDSVLAISVLFDPITALPCTKANLKYLETYLTFLNTNDILYSTEAWNLMDMIRYDIMKTMYAVLVNSLDVGICYFNPEDTPDTLETAIDRQVEKQKKAVLVNINKNKPPTFEEIHALMRLTQEAQIPVIFIQRFFGHKMHWQDMGMLMEDALEIETSFWQALQSLKSILAGSSDN